MWDYGDRTGPGWDCCQCRLDGPNGLFLQCRFYDSLFLLPGAGWPRMRTAGHKLGPPTQAAEAAAPIGTNAEPSHCYSGFRPPPGVYEASPPTPPPPLPSRMSRFYINPEQILIRSFPASAATPTAHALSDLKCACSKNTPIRLRKVCCEFRSHSDSLWMLGKKPTIEGCHCWKDNHVCDWITTEYQGIKWK